MAWAGTSPRRCQGQAPWVRSVPNLLPQKRLKLEPRHASEPALGLCGSSISSNFLQNESTLRFFTWADADETSFLVQGGQVRLPKECITNSCEISSQPGPTRGILIPGESENLANAYHYMIVEQPQLGNDKLCIVHSKHHWILHW